jgi:DNA-binding CsgD family transcriptional regulator
MVATAAGMKRAGFSSKAIAARLSVTTSSVDNKLRKVGAKRNLIVNSRKKFKGFGRQVIEAINGAAETAEVLGASSTI